MASANFFPYSVNSLVRLIVQFPLFAYIVGFLEDFVIGIMRTGPIPKHIALIMDGNRTYAKNHRLPLKDGHFAGANALVKVLEVCYKVGIDQVTIYAFSLENFNRSKEEVDTLFGMLRDKLKLISENEESYARYNKVRIKVIGNRSFIPDDILKDLEYIEQITKEKSSRKTLHVCFPYTARDEITHSIKSIVQKRVLGEIESQDDITAATIEENFYFGKDVYPLDILVRTSGHTRLSDFMLWQCNEGCTIEFPDVLWPDFGFLCIVSVLFKWSYYKTIQLEEEAIQGKKPNLKEVIPPVLLHELPSPPPAASVSRK
ncbi:cis-prenyltransferase [Spathaspora passalidarum NRRL Y-27907]|uniref:Alkyl transferase n=1 Tax=Spathaspora passalidarum (strain NRRL Y-27907 / 11-Y1) TaxID=619300 RepID=G3ANJ9_SPAPN|nr:cis-prenyltransferase [Spathaspora passalidarum NRRL Y-27907]EGW32528.1 cis-prenyltransferase [Spathaspora passalidarum NRRL Y-27907]